MMCADFYQINHVQVALRLFRMIRDIGHSKCSTPRRRELQVAAHKPKEDSAMGYGIAWLLGVPISILVIWFLVTTIL
jgi:hypothetical protein